MFKVGDLVFFEETVENHHHVIAGNILSLACDTATLSLSSSYRGSHQAAVLLENLHYCASYLKE